MRQEQEFTRRWSAKIEADKKTLLWFYRSRVSFPQKPYKPDEITQYVQVVRPLLRRSIFLKRYLPICVVLVCVANSYVGLLPA